jgi:hypothetical protein
MKLKDKIISDLKDAVDKHLNSTTDILFVINVYWDLVLTTPMRKIVDEIFNRLKSLNESKN